MHKYVTTILKTIEPLFRNFRKRPRVSVIVPVYNTSEYISECLDSLLTQTLHNIEIICIDDSSTDNSLDLLNLYAAKDERVIVIEHRQNRGLGGARNTGISHARGDFLCFVDSDDYVDKDFIRKLYGAIKKENADIAMCSYWKDIAGNISPYVKDVSKLSFTIDLAPDETLAIANRYNPACTNKMIRRKIVKDNNLTQPEKKLYEGVLFWVKLVYFSDKMTSTSDRLYFYRQRPGSIMLSLTKKHIEDRIYFIKEIVHFVRDHMPITDYSEQDLLNLISSHLKFGKNQISNDLHNYEELQQLFDARTAELSKENGWPPFNNFYTQKKSIK